MAYDYLGLVNELCAKFNEVPLTSSNFASADGVYTEFKNSVNDGIKAVYQKKNCEWPFAFDEITFKTVIGQGEYTKDANAVQIDWDSFQLLKALVTIDSITQSSGTATATVAAGHQLVTGDNVYIMGANETDYVGWFDVTVTSSTQFTFTVSSSAVTPATGTIKVVLPNKNQYLKFMDIDAYRQEGYQARDNNTFISTEYELPKRVVRKSDNNFIISPKPDRVYTVQYEAFSLPTELVDYDDVPVIPEVWRNIITDAALWNVYMFRDNVEEAALAENKFDKSLEDMARVLIPQTSYMRIVD